MIYDVKPILLLRGIPWSTGNHEKIKHGLDGAFNFWDLKIGKYIARVSNTGPKLRFPYVDRAEN